LRALRRRAAHPGRAIAGRLRARAGARRRRIEHARRGRQCGWNEVQRRPHHALGGRRPGSAAASLRRRVALAQRRRALRTSPDALAKAVGASDEEGVAAVSDLGAGFHAIELTSADGLFSGRVSASLTTRRTELSGVIQQDTRDLDEDGDRDEWVMAVEVLPDED